MDSQSKMRWSEGEKSSVRSGKYWKWWSSSLLWLQPLHVFWKSDGRNTAAETRGCRGEWPSGKRANRACCLQEKPLSNNHCRNRHIPKTSAASRSLHHSLRAFWNQHEIQPLTLTLCHWRCSHVPFHTKAGIYFSTTSMEGSKHATVVILSSSSIRDRFNILLLSREILLCVLLLLWDTDPCQAQRWSSLNTWQPQPRC